MERSYKTSFSLTAAGGAAVPRGNSQSLLIAMTDAHNFIVMLATTAKSWLEIKPLDDGVSRDKTVLISLIN